MYECSIACPKLEEDTSVSSLRETPISDGLSPQCRWWDHVERLGESPWLLEHFDREGIEGNNSLRSVPRYKTQYLSPPGVEG